MFPPCLCSSHRLSQTQPLLLTKKTFRHNSILDFRNVKRLHIDFFPRRSDFLSLFFPFVTSCKVRMDDLDQLGSLQILYCFRGHVARKR
ncbi:hypothetical protein M438DRAFT_97614 [Aureobasidium pullulans EXF-150]|uniref:Uncharacterized protein n=1 Tax=Aureobasidium pullulans EXF-150 TaxID=1043002 RepID=A0A074XGH4_AURPU|nr:uncharacterized protein M438DRAFT_97614 [Aureobasidium pullulans EXF-150]KEQ81142.1 hypothetical protein M438DRAFT_97614 [Aureobasidium pullulans EXF-150]